MKPNALILTNGMFDTPNAKTAHGLIRASDRFNIVGVIDFMCAGRDAGEVLDGKVRQIPIFSTVETALTALQSSSPPQYLIVGVAVAGGKLPVEMLDILKTGIQNGLNIVNGLHEFLTDKPDFVVLAAQYNVTLTDVRRAKKASEMQYWSGKIASVRVPRVAILGMDCAVGKRTTTRFLVEAARADGLRAEMISTGQTGWMQDGRFGFLLDSTLNDFVSGELETEIIRAAETAPDVIFVNGQSALRNPIGPCGSELLLSGQCKWVVLQAIPSRKYYEGTEETLKAEIPSVASEIELIRMYGAEVIAVTVNTEDLSLAEARKYAEILRGQLGGLPVVLPLEDGVGEVLEAVKKVLVQG